MSDKNMADRKTIEVLLADDHQVVREGLKALINAEGDLRVVGEAEDGDQVLPLAKKTQPDVIIMDVSMPRLNGLQATQQLKEQCPQIKVLVLTVHEDTASLQQLIGAGAVGYVVKRAAGSELVHAIRTVASGGVLFDAALASASLAHQATASIPARPPRAVPLSAREEKVLRLTAWGYTIKEIASELRISAKTVETYKARLQKKLSLRTRTDIVRYALRQGWLKES